MPSIAENEIHEFLDGRLDKSRREEICARLDVDPDLAGEFEKLRRQDEALRELGAAVLREPVPEHLRAVVRRAARDKVAPPRKPRRYFMQAAAAAMLLIVGGIGGWGLHGFLHPLPSPLESLLDNASYAYTFYGGDEGVPFGFSADRSDDFGKWIKKVFGRQVPYPDLSTAGYQFAGGNILPGAGGQTGFFFFAQSNGPTVSVVFWSSEDKPTDAFQLAEFGDVSARYWFVKNLGFAVLGNRSDDALERISEDVFKFYGEAPWEG